MDIEAVQDLVNSAVLEKAGRPLSEIESVVLRGAWEGQTYEEMAIASGYAVNSLKNDAGPNFWRFLSSNVFGEKISKANLRAVLERHYALTLSQRAVPFSRNPQSAEAVIQTKSFEAATRAQIDWGEAPNLEFFYGRSAELNDLQQKIVQRKSQLVALQGLKGIGKTTLAVKLVEQAKGEFEQVIWRSLFRDPPTTLLNLVADLLQSLIGESRLNLPPSLDERISLLIDQFQVRRCLVVLDNVEALMQEQSLAGQYKPNYEEYGDFLRRVGIERHQSCVLLIGQTGLQEIAELEAQQFPVCTVAISGLSMEDANKLLIAKGLVDQEYWPELINIFQSNPLALQIVSARIQRSFGGSVSDFLKQKTIANRQIEDLIDHQFNCLSALEKEAIYWLAIRQQPLSFSDLRDNIKVSGSKLLDAIESLIKRSLIQGEAKFTLEPIVRQYVLNEFAKEKISLDVSQAKLNIQQLLERCFDKD